MSACDQELCPQWSGSGCVCEVFSLDRPERCDQCGWPMVHGKCGQCGHIDYDHWCSDCSDDPEES